MSDEPGGDVGVTQLAAITGLSRESCAAMLSRAGGDVTTAVNRHFAAHDTRDGGALASTSTPASQPPPSVVGEKRRRSSSAARGSPAKARLGSGGGDQQQRSVLSFFQKGQVDRAEAPEDHAPPPIAARAPPKSDDRADEVSDVEPAGERIVATLALHGSGPDAEARRPTAEGGGAGSRRDDSPWPTSDTETPYLLLSRCFDELSSSAKRIRKGDALRGMFVEIMNRAPRDLLAAVYLTFGRCAERHEVGSELVVGGATVGASIAEAAGVSKQTVARMNDELGDLGDVAVALKRRQVTLAKPKPLTVRRVLETLRAIASEKGAGSAGRKKDRVLGLMRAAREGEIRWLTRTLIRNMRIGANKISVLHALASAAETHHSRRDGNAYGESPNLAVVGKEGEAKLGVTPAMAAVQRAYSLCPSVDVLVPALVEGGVPNAVRSCTMRPFTPVKPMLASITAGAADAVTRIVCKREEDEESGKTFLVEYKYDGVRAQIHVAPSDDGGDDWAVKIFSRNCEDRTAAFPDVANIVLEGAKGGSGMVVDPHTGRGGGGLILDAEMVGIDRSTGRLRAFQDLASRPRGGVNEAELAARTAVDVVVFAFDLVWVGDKGGVTNSPTGDAPALHDMSLRDRRRELVNALPGLSRMPGRLELARSAEVDAPTVREPNALGSDDDDRYDDRLLPAIETVRAFMLESLDAACEGVMLKRLDGDKSRYSPSKRSDCWLKLKKDYCENLRDSLDLVPIGAWFGQGRKAGWYSPFLLAVYDPETETYQSMCRCMSGFTDEFYRTRRENFGKPPSLVESGVKPPVYDTLEQPDVWFNPTEVWEIRGADLTLSPKHRAAAGARHEERGISLRFPRFIRVRDDKNVEDASGPEEVARLFDAQQSRYDGQGESATRRLAEQAALDAEAEKDEGDSDEDDDGGDREPVLDGDEDLER